MDHKAIIKALTTEQNNRMTHALFELMGVLEEGKLVEFKGSTYDLSINFTIKELESRINAFTLMEVYFG